tara:strand:+ start:143 stop:286 length:144 start_codon:yes stop_codon:yes gene_type:complete
VVLNCREGEKTAESVNLKYNKVEWYSRKTESKSKSLKDKPQRKDEDI